MHCLRSCNIQARRTILAAISQPTNVRVPSFVGKIRSNGCREQLDLPRVREGIHVETDFNLVGLLLVICLDSLQPVLQFFQSCVVVCGADFGVCDGDSHVCESGFYFGYRDWLVDGEWVAAAVDGLVDGAVQLLRQVLVFNST